MFKEQSIIFTKIKSMQITGFIHINRLNNKTAVIEKNKRGGTVCSCKFPANNAGMFCQ
jgi:hypothetical protein